MNVRIEPSWKELVGGEFEQPYFKKLTGFVKAEYSNGTCYPPGALIFNAFEQCVVEATRVVILGQDPYIGPGQAHGLSFSVPEGVPFPPSLRNILKEVSRDIGAPLPESGNLERWAKQGVLLLNATLTVRAGQSASHQGQGWETFTDAVIEHLSTHSNGCVFMLWGSYAGKKASLINEEKHLILKAPHPSPLSAHRGFNGCGHFSAANAWLIQNKQLPIQW